MDGFCQGLCTPLKFHPIPRRLLSTRIYLAAQVSGLGPGDDVLWNTQKNLFCSFVYPLAISLDLSALCIVNYELSFWGSHRFEIIPHIWMLHIAKVGYFFSPSLSNIE